MNEDELFFNRAQAAQYLKERWGLRVSRSTLAKYAIYGCGPRFFKPATNQVVYARSELDRWARERLGPARASTADAVGHAPAATRAGTEADRGGGR